MKVGFLTVTRSDKIMLSVIAVFVVGGGCWSYLAHKGSKADEARYNAALTALGEQIPLGMKQVEALQRIRTLLGDDLKVSEQDQPDELIHVQTPMRWHAKDWCLLLLVSDGCIAAKVYRCRDSWREKRSGSPEDVVAEGFVLPKRLQAYRQNPS